MSSTAWRRRLSAAAALFLAAICAAPQLASASSAQPDPRTLAYRRAWGLQAVGADAAYRAGYTGKGVRIAVIDCGVRRPTPELKRNLSQDSTDLIGPRQAEVRTDHGDRVAAPLSGGLNSSGLIGIAYNSTLIEVRADMDGGYNGECAFWPNDVARALDYAVDREARVVVLPLQSGSPLGAEFETALARAVQRGVVVVAAAGNNGGRSKPAYPAYYAADPRFARGMLVAGATTFHGDMADWSDRAGPTKARYILAPGEWVLTNCRELCNVVSGTSYSAPFVAGAVALMMEAHPDLSGPEVAERVLAATRDMGAPGADAVYGRGRLDLSRAFEAAPLSPQRSERARG